MTEDLLAKARETINEIDKEMARLFTLRMEAVKTIAEYKSAKRLEIFDARRETEVIDRNSTLVNQELRGYYLKFLKSNMEISKSYQRELIPTENRIHIDLGDQSYDLHIGHGLMESAGELFDLDRKVLILTDSGVPSAYAEAVKAKCRLATVLTMPEGEGSKSIEGLSTVLSTMADIGMTRSDCLVAVGGGVVGDLGGFAAATYMRGIDFYNIPTTLLSQVDSSIGGKTAINHGGIKNLAGAFYQPKGVIIDPSLLLTLPKRHFAAGMAEVIKMAVSLNANLFEKIERGADILEIIESAIRIKKAVVEADVKENGLRRVLNLGHTLGHAIEATDPDFIHGECVSIGMMAVCSKEVKARLVPLLKRYGLPIEYNKNPDSAISKITLDKKSEGGNISVIYVDKIGSYRIEKMDAESFASAALGELK